MKKLYSKKEAADALAMSIRRLECLMRDGAIAAVSDGSNVKITDDEINRYINGLPAWEPRTA